MHSPQASYTISLKEVRYPRRSQHSPAQYTDIPNKYPRQSWPKDCSPAVYQTFNGGVSPAQFKTSPGESNQDFPRKVGIHLPSRKFIPSRFWKLIPAEHERVPRLDSKSYFLTRIWLGYPQPKATKRSSSTKSSYTQRNLLTLPIQQWYPQQVIINNSTKYLYPHRVLLPSKIVEYFSPRRVFCSPSIFPNGVIFSYRYSCNYHP